MRRTRSRPLPLISATVFALVAASAVSGQEMPGIPIPPLPDSMVQRIAGEITEPEGFVMGVFAAPPHLTYPTTIQPAGDGVVFAGTDPNLLFGRERYRGRILRFVDQDGDGSADRYTVFADSLDAIRGLAVDGETVFAMHAPTLAAYRDTDGDGVADERRVLVEGLGFGLDDRNGDHSSNGLRLGIDGWIYIAVGDYGFLGATGSDGTQLRLHGGGVVRVRPDGTEMEIVARGTRNIYDVALDPWLRLFARDNTNNGQGWNSMFHYLPTGSDAGYPSLFRNFPEEVHEPLADFGAGAATTTLWISEPSFPPGLSHTLLSSDWALNAVYRHELAPSGASFRISQQELMSIPNPVDMEVDRGGNLFIASLSGGSYDYAGEHVGYIVRLRPTTAPPTTEAVQAREEGELVEAVLSGSAMRGLAAQRELLARGASASGIRRLEEAVEDRELRLPARVMALFTLKQLRGERSHPVLVRAASDPALRAMALRALADRRGETEGVPPSLFVRFLSDPDPFVRLQAVTGLGRLGAGAAAEHLLQAATSPDATIAHVARNAVAAMGAGAAEAVLEAFDSGGAAQKEAALHILGRMHSPAVVGALAARLARTRDPEPRRAITGTLARLFHREGLWEGEWWGNQPNTEGPYFNPVRWEESVRIRPLLIREVQNASGEHLSALLELLEREAVLPRASAELLSATARIEESPRLTLIDALVGGRELRTAAIPLLASLGARDAALRRLVAAMLVASPAPPAAAARPIAELAVDSALPVDLRARALAALGRIAEGVPPELAAETYARTLPELPARPALLQAWRRFVDDRGRVSEWEAYARLAETGTGEERVVGYAVLVQIAGASRNPAESRARAASVVNRAWTDRESAAALVRAITLLGVEDRYAEALAAHRQGGG